MAVAPPLPLANGAMAPATPAMPAMPATSGPAGDDCVDQGAAPALAALWQLAALPAQALAQADVSGLSPVLPSSFAVATAAQASLGAAALAAAELWHLRQGGSLRQQLKVERGAALLECTGHFTLDGQVPPLWDKLSGLYRCADEGGAPAWLRLHANFAHHRDGALRLLGLAPGPGTPREQVAVALRSWSAVAFEDAAAQQGLVAAAVRSFADWDSHPQAAALAHQPVLDIRRIGEAPPLRWTGVAPAVQRPPLDGLRVLDLTRILAGPVACRTLAAHGAEVLMVNAPHLPNILAISDTSRGKRSALLDLNQPAGVQGLQGLVRGAHVFVQGYRPGGLAQRGFGAQALAALRPGIVVVTLSAYGTAGPWAGRRGFDSLVQSATGFNHAEAEAARLDPPQALPVQILDYAAGYLMAFGAQAALWQQLQQGGSWQVQVSLAGVGRWLRSLGRVPGGLGVPRPLLDVLLQPQASGFGALACLPHAAELSHTPPGWRLPSMPPGSHQAAWLPI